MKNITVSIEDDLYRRARVRAAEEGTSVSRVVRETLTKFAHQETLAEARGKALRALFHEVNTRLAGQRAQPVDPDWRQKMYDERFDESVLGKSLVERDR